MTQTVAPVPEQISPGSHKTISADLAAELPQALRGQLPPGLMAVSIWSTQAASPLKICVICRKAPDPVQRHLLSRRDTLDAKVYLGCITDSYGVMEFVDIWIQSIDGLAEAAKANILCNDAVNNTTLDDRWKSLYGVCIDSWPSAFVACGYERTNPPPTLIDPHVGNSVQLDGWELCRDDEVLGKAGLPQYSSTVHRYLYRPRGSGEAKFVPLLPECPRKSSTVEYETIVPNFKQLVALNPGGGLVLVKPAANLRLDEFNALLSGKRYEGVTYGKSRLRFGPLQSLSSISGGFIFPGEPQNNATRFVETYLLKLRLISGLVEEVGRFTHSAQRPLLNIQPSSFAVRLDDSGMQLPTLWSARVLLTDPGDAIPIALPQGDSNNHFCLPGKTVKTCIFQPAIVPRGSVSGFGEVYLSGLFDTGKGKVFDGMLTVSDPIRPTARDIFRIRIPVADKRVDLYVKVDPASSPSQSVLKFRSVLDDRLKPVQADVERLIGVPLQQVSFEFFPLFSSACDIYSLAVIAVDILLTRPDTSHAEQLREVLTLVTRCRETAGKTLEARIATVFSEKGDWYRKLGPQMLINAPMEPQRALRFLTPDLWWATLALILRLFPGQGNDSLLSDFGDTVQGRMHGAYQAMMQDISRLVQRSRSLLFGEWGTNRQLGLMIEELRGPRSKN